MKFKVDNITVKILDSSPPSTPEEDINLLSQYIYNIVDLGVKRERKRAKTLKTNQ